MNADAATIPQTRAQRAALGDLGRHADNLRRAAAGLVSAGTEIAAAVSAGRRPFGLSHQLPHDLWTAQAKMEAAIDACVRLDVPEDLLAAAMADDMAVHTLTHIAKEDPEA